MNCIDIRKCTILSNRVTFSRQTILQSIIYQQSICLSIPYVKYLRHKSNNQIKIYNVRYEYNEMGVYRMNMISKRRYKKIKTKRNIIF